MDKRVHLYTTSTNTKDCTIYTLNGTKGSTFTLQQHIQRTVQFLHLMDQKGPPVHYNNKYKGTVQFIR